MLNKQETSPTSVGEVEVFNFSEKKSPIRVQTINGEPWFVAKDLCDILELNDVRRAVEPLDDDEKLSGELLQSGQLRSMWLVNESGMYTLIIRSRKPEAKKFRKWVTSEVLPSIRKTGRYELSSSCVSSPVRPRRRRGLLVDAELTNLLWLIGESLWHGDLVKVAMDLGVSRQAVYSVLNGYTRSSRILTALYQLARERRECSEIYNRPGDMADKLLGVSREVSVGNSLPTVHVHGRRGGKLGNQNARKYWRKEGE